MKKKSSKKYYSAIEIREKILNERKLPKIVGKGNYTPAIFGGGGRKIILK